ncbi:hypothetical protein KRP22_009091 [Phytophthora ramorum]|nr:hypothetical protein KRP22_7922 [Phytophthora ramorum]
MRGDDIVKDSTAAEATTSKKEKGDKPRAKRTRRQFREDAQRAQAHAQPQAQEVQDVRSDADGAERELIRSDSATSLSPSAIVEMFHLQGDENSRVISGATTARYLVENEVSGDFYQVRTRQRKLHSSLPEHAQHRRSSLIKAQQKLRDSSTKAENWRWWAILQRDGEKAAVVVALGIVAGMCWMDVLNLRSGTASSSTSGADRFLCTYSAGANRTRQNLFILFKYPSRLESLVTGLQ